MKKKFLLLLALGVLSGGVYAKDSGDEELITVTKPKSTFASEWLHNDSGNKDIAKFTMGQGNLYFRDDLWVEYRVRRFIGTDGEEYKSGTKSETDTRFRLHKQWNDFHKSRVEYRSYSKTYDSVEYHHFFQFKDKLGLPERFSNFSFAPYVGLYNADEEGNRTVDLGDGQTASEKYSKDAVKVGLDWYWTFNFTDNFYTNFALYLDYYMYEDDQHYARDYNNGVYEYELEDNKFNATVEWYFYYNRDLITFENSKFYFYFEGGFDPYSWSNREVFIKNKDGEYDDIDDTSYHVYFAPEIRYEHEVMDDVSVYAGVGVEWNNAIIDDVEDQERTFSDYDDQWFARVGVKTKF